MTSTTTKWYGCVLGKKSSFYKSEQGDICYKNQLACMPQILFLSSESQGQIFVLHVCTHPRPCSSLFDNIEEEPLL